MIVVFVIGCWYIVSALCCRLFVCCVACSMMLFVYDELCLICGSLCVICNGEFCGVIVVLFCCVVVAKSDSSCD